MSAIETVGVIGLGNMGGGMAASLARAKFKVLGLDMDPDKSVAGVEPVANVAELAAVRWNW